MLVVIEDFILCYDDLPQILQVLYFQNWVAFSDDESDQVKPIFYLIDVGFVLSKSFMLIDRLQLLGCQIWEPCFHKVHVYLQILDDRLND